MNWQQFGHDVVVALAVVLFAGFSAIVLGRNPVRPDHRGPGDEEDRAASPSEIGIHEDHYGA